MKAVSLFLALALATPMITAAKEKKEKPQDARTTIAASPEAIKAYFLRLFVPYGYSIDSDTTAQLQVSRPMTWTETMRWETDNWITGNPSQCRRSHTLLFLPGANGTDVTMRWETICQQPRGGVFRVVNSQKKEIEHLSKDLGTAKESLESQKSGQEATQ